MSNQTKACNLNELEIKTLIQYHGAQLYQVDADTIERINYLHRRLEAFGKPETGEGKKPDPLEGANPAPPAPATEGWGT